jgi:hypothetical protein
MLYMGELDLYLLRENVEISSLSRIWRVNLRNTITCFAHVTNTGFLRLFKKENKNKKEKKNEVFPGRLVTL